MEGYVLHFNAERGYGFIGTNEQEENIFVHISEVKNSKKLTQGQTVEFDLEKTKKGFSAVNVMAGKKRQSPYLIFGLVSFFIVLAIFFYTSQYVSTLIAYLIAINIGTFFLYGYDKYISSGEKLRIPEINLQTLALLGGSPAALLAQKFFRHKTIKGSFQVIYWLIVVGQVGLIFLLQ